ncbi:MAG: PhnD/SsuA/transferrin family substrate-binding protein [Pseudoruegeria sp.]
MIASLMMYARPQLADAHVRYWRLIRSELQAIGINAPEALSQEADAFSVWKHPDLVLSQTCGMPYRTSLHDRVELVGTPDFGVEGCPEGYYRSAIVVRASDPRRSATAYGDAVFAYNQSCSQSGFAAPYYHFKPLGFWFENRLLTGGHLESARAVVQGRADIAALDAVSWRLMQQYEGFASDLRVLEWTAPTPGLPYIAAKGRDVRVLSKAIAVAIDRLTGPDRHLLGIRRLVAIPKADYLKFSNPPA